MYNIIIMVSSSYYFETNINPVANTPNNPKRIIIRLEGPKDFVGDAFVGAGR